MSALVLQEPWTRSPDELLQHFSVDKKRGLSSEEAARHAELYGKNGMQNIFFPAPLFIDICLTL